MFTNGGWCKLKMVVVRAVLEGIPFVLFRKNSVYPLLFNEFDMLSVYDKRILSNFLKYTEVPLN